MFDEVNVDEHPTFINWQLWRMQSADKAGLKISVYPLITKTVDPAELNGIVAEIEKEASTREAEQSRAEAATVIESFTKLMTCPPVFTTSH